MDITQTEAYEVNSRLIEVSYEEKKLSKSHYEFFKSKQPKNMEEVAEMAREIIYAVKHAEYYITLDSLEQGLEFIQSIDSTHKLWEAANAKCERLRASLERLSPKGESA